MCAIAELMASRNKVARRKGKGGAGDEVRYLASFTFPKCCILKWYQMEATCGISR